MSHVIEHHHLSERRACGLVRLGRSTRRYQPRPRDDEQALRKRLRELAAERPRFGYRRLTALLGREGRRVNPKRVHRLYREEGLALHRKTRRKLSRAGTPSAAPQSINERWSMDFVSDQLASGRSFRNLTLVDEYTRECLAIKVDTSLGGATTSAGPSLPNPPAGAARRVRLSARFFLARLSRSVSPRTRTHPQPGVPSPRYA